MTAKINITHNHYCQRVVNNYKNMEKKCKDCKYYKNLDCRRFPPSIGYGRGTGFPSVAKEEWCGEFKPK